MDGTQQPVVVAVGPDGSAAAIRFGVVEALRRRRGLHLLHAVGSAATDSQTNRRRGQDAARLLDLVEREAGHAVAGAVRVTTAVVEATPAQALAGLPRETPLVILGHRLSAPRVHRQLHSASDQIAAHVRVPLVRIPDQWRPPGSEALVVVAVDPARLCLETLHAGFTAARERHARLLLLAACWRPVGADGRNTLGHVDERAGADLIVEEVLEAAAALRAWYGEVHAEVAVSRAPAVRALVSASDDADLLVLGRHEPWLVTGSCLGPVARTVLHDANCPVLLTAVDTRQPLGHARGA